MFGVMWALAIIICSLVNSAASPQAATPFAEACWTGEPGLPTIPPPSPANARTLVEAMGWATAAAKKVMESPAIRGRMWPKLITLSTAFSGVGTGELAMRALAQAFAKLGLAIEVRDVFAVEKSVSCQEELLSVLHPEAIIDGGPCIFGDIMQLLPRKVLKTLRVSIASTQPEALRKLVMTSRLNRELWCVARGRKCLLRHSDYHLAGTPCVEASRMGTKSRGWALLVFYTWAAMILLLLPMLVIHENVPEFGTADLEQALGSAYVIVARVLLCPSDLGWAIRRPRQFCLLARRTLVKIPRALTQDYVDRLAVWLLYRKRSYGWTEHFWMESSDPELLLEEAWALGRKAVKHRRAMIASGVDAHCDDMLSWASLLTPRERERVEHYKFILPGEVADLHQEADQKAIVSKNGELGTVVKSVGLMWSGIMGRWLARKELLAAMGFPITLEHVTANSGVASSFSIGCTPPVTRSHHSQGEACGNAFHMNAIGGTMLLALVIFPELGGGRLTSGGLLPSATSSSTSHACSKTSEPPEPPSRGLKRASPTSHVCSTSSSACQTRPDGGGNNRLLRMLMRRDSEQKPP